MSCICWHDNVEAMRPATTLRNSRCNIYRAVCSLNLQSMNVASHFADLAPGRSNRIKCVSDADIMFLVQEFSIVSGVS